MPPSLTQDYAFKIKYKTAEQKVFALGSFILIRPFIMILSVHHPPED